MKYSLIILSILLLLGCSSLKPKVQKALSGVHNAMEILNDKYCQEKTEVMRELLISQIRFYFPFYPDEGYCLLVGDKDVQ